MKDEATLRDHFASQALCGIIQTLPHTSRKESPFRKGETLADVVARNSYAYADAMLKAREKP
jgi:hypothetical protein